MADTNPVSPAKNFFANLVANEATSLGATALATKGASYLGYDNVFPVPFKDGMIVSALNSAVTSVAQRLTGFDSNSFPRILVTAATLALTYFGLTSSYAAPLLGRVGIEMSNQAFMYLAGLNLIADVFSMVVFGKSAEEPDTKKVKKLTEEQVKEHFAKLDEQVEKKEVTESFAEALQARFVEMNLYVAPKTAEEADALAKHVVAYIFNHLGDFKVEEAAVKALTKRFEDQELLPKAPADEESVKALTDAQVFYIFANLANFKIATEAMTHFIKRVQDAGHAPEKITTGKEVTELKPVQVRFLHATGFNNAEGEAKTQLEKRYVDLGLVAAVKTADTDTTAWYETAFNTAVDFGYAAESAITAGLSKVTPQFVQDRIPQFAKDHSGKIYAAAALYATGETTGLIDFVDYTGWASYGFGALKDGASTGWDKLISLFSSSDADVAKEAAKKAAESTAV